MKRGNSFSPTRKEVIYFAIVFAGIALVMLYSSCIIPCFCKYNKDERHEDADLLEYLLKIQPEDIKSIRISLYMKSCFGDSKFNAYSERILLSEISDIHKKPVFVASIRDLKHYYPAHDLLYSLAYIKTEFNNGQYVVFDTRRDPRIGDTAYIYLSASPEIEKLAGFRLMKGSYHFKSNLLYQWIAEVVRSNQSRINCCECQLNSGHIKHKPDAEDEPCFLCIM
jgi:hypothetical protein